jgi:uncharacterized protein (TIGR03083 family)
VSEPGQQVRQTTEECGAFLVASEHDDWSRSIPGMDRSVAQVVAHIASGLLWYATDLCAGPPELSTMDLSVKSESAPADLIRTITSFAGVLASVIDCMPPDARGFHPFGLADSSGFAAMACDEMLVHTDDAARGLGREFTPSGALAESTLRRLFPWAPQQVDPWAALRWANGRISLPGLNLQSDWRWHCAPLQEWDGANPSESA